MNDPSGARESTSRIGETARCPFRELITMRRSQDQSARLRRRRVEPPTGLARRHWHRSVISVPGPLSSTFLRSLRSRPITALHRSYGRSDSCPGGSPALGQRQDHRLFPEQVSLIHAFGLPAIPSPPTCGCSASPRYAACRRVGPRFHPHGSSPNGNSGLRLWLAGSSHLTGRIEFSFLPYRGDFLRTSRSPPAAPHPASRRRSCSRLQVTLTWRGLAPLRLNALSGALAHGASRGLRRLPSPPSGGGVRATLSPGLRPGLRYFAPPGLRSLHFRPI